MEIERALFRLQALRVDDPGLPEQQLGMNLQQRLDNLRASKVYAQLVQGIFLVDPVRGKTLMVKAGELVPAKFPPNDWTNPIADATNWLKLGPGPMPGPWLRNDLRLCGIGNALDPDKMLFVRLNRAFLLDSLFVQTLESYLGPRRWSDLDVLMLQDQDGIWNVVYASSDEARTISPEGADVTVPFLRGISPRAFGPERPGGQPPPDEIFRGWGKEERAERPWPVGGMLELRIRHRSGSLEAAVRQNRLINLAIGSGILVLMLVVIGVILLISRRAERLAQQQIEFVAGISHEFRTPLAVLQSIGDNMADGVVTEASKARSYGAMVRTEVHRLHTMVENALAYAGMVSSKRPAEFHPIDLCVIVRQACQSSQALLEEHGVEMDVDLPPAVPATPGDASSLRSAVENLLSNAVKYSPENPWIGIAVGNDPLNAEVTVAVSDHGMGIPRQEVPHLFDPFYRGREAIKKQIQGSGLGLHLVHHIVARHGGRVTVESTPGEGSRFIIHLPAYRTEQGTNAS
jgi:signal transduction histidine kinase